MRHDDPWSDHLKAATRDGLSTLSVLPTPDGPVALKHIGGAFALLAEDDLLAGPRAVPCRPGSGQRVIAADSGPPAEPEVDAVSCADTRHEIIEAFRWARALLAAGIPAADIALTAAASSPPATARSAPPWPTRSCPGSTSRCNFALRPPSRFGWPSTTCSSCS